jgi:hypothetical protein
MAANPWGNTLNLASNAVAYNLFALIQAADVTVKYPQCCKLSIQLDPAAGAGKLYIGNSDVSSSNRGTELVAGQAKEFEGIEQNLYSLQNVWLRGSVDNLKVNINYVVH